VAVAANKAPGPTANPGTAAGANCGVTDPQALAEIQALRADFFAARKAWFDKWGTNRTSATAQAELAKLRTAFQAKVQAVFDKYGIDATAGTGAGNGGHGQGGGMMGGGQGYGQGQGACVNP